MKALRCIAPHDVQIVNIPNPLVGKEQLLIAPIATGICGTDIEIIEGGVDPAFIRYPITLGHEWLGQVIDSSSEMNSFSPGIRVVVEGIIPCEVCDECKAGDTNRCATYDEIGFTRDGAAAAQIVVPTKLAHKIADHVTDESAALVEPAAVVFQGLMRINPEPNSKILVIGDGTIGLLATTLVKSFAPKALDVFGIRSSQQDLIIRAGADRFVTDPNQLTKDYDVIIEAAGAISAVELALSQGRRGAKTLLLGYPEQGARLSLGVHDLINNDGTIHASFSYTRRSWKAVVDLLNSGELDLSFVVTHKFALREWPQALATLKTVSSEPRGKVLLLLNLD
jgi:2-desacetyl-2-hydroxyethyl bacteriochlorophyllide A dehydrogenase